MSMASRGFRPKGVCAIASSHVRRRDCNNCNAVAASSRVAKSGGTVNGAARPRGTPPALVGTMISVPVRAASGRSAADDGDFAPVGAAPVGGGSGGAVGAGGADGGCGVVVGASSFGGGGG